MLDMDKYDMAIELGSAEGGLNLMAFYTYNEKGEKVYGGFQAGSTTKLPTTEIPPGCAATPAGLSVRYHSRPEARPNFRPRKFLQDAPPLRQGFPYAIRMWL